MATAAARKSRSRRASERAAARKQAKWKRRMARADRIRDRYCWWRPAILHTDREVWVCCDEFGQMPRTGIRILFASDGREYTPNRRSLSLTVADRLYRLVEGRFAPAGPVSRPPARSEAPESPSGTALREGSRLPTRSSLLDGEGPRLAIYSDGSFCGRRQAAGCAAVFLDQGRSYSHTRSLKLESAMEAEMAAAVLGLEQIADPATPVTLYVDSADVVRILVDRRWARKVVSSLAVRLCQLYDQLTDIRVVKVRGHSGVAGNEKAHRLAYQAMKR